MMIPTVFIAWPPREQRPMMMVKVTTVAEPWFLILTPWVTRVWTLWPIVMTLIQIAQVGVFVLILSETVVLQLTVNAGAVYSRNSKLVRCCNNAWYPSVVNKRILAPFLVWFMFNLLILEIIVWPILNQKFFVRVKIAICSWDFYVRAEAKSNIHYSKHGRYLLVSKFRRDGDSQQKQWHWRWPRVKHASLKSSRFLWVSD